MGCLLKRKKFGLPIWLEETMPDEKMKTHPPFMNGTIL